MWGPFEKYLSMQGESPEVGVCLVPSVGGQPLRALHRCSQRAAARLVGSSCGDEHCGDQRTRIQSDVATKGYLVYGSTLKGSVDLV